MRVDSGDIRAEGIHDHPKAITVTMLSQVRTKISSVESGGAAGSVFAHSLALARKVACTNARSGRARRVTCIFDYSAS